MYHGYLLMQVCFYTQKKKVKIQWKTYSALSEIPATRLHLRGHTAGFRPQTQKLEASYKIPSITLWGRVNAFNRCSFNWQNMISKEIQGAHNVYNFPKLSCGVIYVHVFRYSNIQGSKKLEFQLGLLFKQLSHFVYLRPCLPACLS